MNSDFSQQKIYEKHYDVIVIGGGVSGAIAGIASAGHGAKTLVVEQHGFPGGALTAMGVGPMMSFHNRAGRQLIRGIPQKLIDRMIHHDASPGHIPDSTTYCSTVTPFDSEYLKIALEKMLDEAGGDILYHSQFVQAKVDNRHVKSIVICNKSGLKHYEATVFVDATGDADLASSAGVKCVNGREADSSIQPMTMNMKIGNVDVDKIREYAENNPEDFHFAHSMEDGLKRLKTTPRISLAGYLREWEKACKTGEIDIPRDLVLFFETANPGVVIVNTSRIQGLNPTDPSDISRAEIIGREQCLKLFSFLKMKCIGFEHAINMGTSAHIGVRESRHIRGIYTLTEEDIIEGREFSDPIAMGGYPIDIHSSDKAETNTTYLRPDIAYQIPMRCMIVDQPDNLITVGRAISATHEASAAIRVSPIAMAIGQAGGTLAAQAVREKTEPNVSDYNILRATLEDDNAILS